MASKEGRGRIECWSTYRDEFAAPEVPPGVQGRLGDGRAIVTSPIVRSEGKVVFTASGHRYELGEPDPRFVEWLRSNDYQFDPENPIKTVAKPSMLKPPPDLRGKS